MNTPKNPKNYEQEYYEDSQGNLHYVQRTSETERTHPDSYTHGYVHGRSAERSYRNDLAIRDSENTARGLLVGVLLATVAVLGGAYAWYVNQLNNSVTSPSPVVVPVPEKTQPNPSPAANSEPQTKTTIIERVKEVPVEKVREVPVFVPAPEQPETAPEATSNPSSTLTEPANVPPSENQNTTSESNNTDTTTDNNNQSNQ